MSHHVDFSSWPRDQEQAFAVYEERAAQSQSKAITISAIVSIAFLVLSIGIYAGVEPDKKDISKDMNMSNLTKKSAAPAPAPKPTPAVDPTPAPPTPAPAEAPADDKKPADPAAPATK